VHARKYLTARGVHRQFIKRLAARLPAKQRPPIILTDAGFRTTWFRMIAAQALALDWAHPQSRLRAPARRPYGFPPRRCTRRRRGRRRTWVFMKRSAITHGSAALR
jgi:hypothetical protein